VFPRTAKAVPLSDEMRRALDVDAEALPPDELIRAILRSPVDLLWNGGVGTYVKASTETNSEVGDKNNDAVRIDATALRCRVVGEGGNLGLTQRGRIEFALNGGHINTDAIDNAAGVNCSDHEVNIKILLDRVVRDGDLTAKQRDALLVAMTDDVAAQVLGDNDGQTRALYIAAAQAAAMRDVHVRYLDELERSEGLDRGLEQLPTGDELQDRVHTGGGLTMPEFAVVLAYSKIALFGELLASDVPEDPFLGRELEQYFPEVLRSRYPDQIREHPLRREIIATRVTNSVVDRAGTTFVFRLAEETGMAAPDVARAHTAAQEIFGLRTLWAQIAALDDVVSTETQTALLLEVRRLAERASRWLLRNRTQPLDIAATTEFFRPGVRELALLIPELVAENRRPMLESTVAAHIDDGVPDDLARSVVTLPDLISALDITTVARSTQRPVGDVVEVYFALGEYLKLDWLRGRILDLPRDDRWQNLARAALREDLHVVHSAITAEVLRTSPPIGQGHEQVRRWVGTIEAAADRCLRMLGDIMNSSRFDLATLSVALREIRTLVQASAPETPEVSP
jgi:glutamate dehydrogenase